MVMGMDTLERPQTSQVPNAPRWPFILAGVIGAAAAFAVGELVAGLVFAVPSSIVAVADLVVEVSPEALTKWAIRTFGTADKLVLVLSILTTAALAAVAIGRRAAVSTRVGVGVIWGFAALAWIALLRSPGVSLTWATITAVGSGLVGVLTFTRLASLARRAAGENAPMGSGEGAPQSEAARPGVGRRAFLAGAGAIAVVAAGSIAVGRTLAERARVMASSRADVTLPTPRETLPPVDATVPVDDVSPFITPTEDFYRIDTAISVPMVNLSDWTVQIKGLVDRPYSLSYDELLAMDLIERDVTICCVSNEVGGDLIGTARWLGVPLDEVLDRAGADYEGTQLVGRSVDGFTVGFPTELAADGRTALLAIGMNGEPLPFEHGFPARMIVSGLYGYVSATKWLSEIEITPWDAFDAYWIPRGWAKEAPIKIQSRIDTPRNGRDFPVGPVPIGGVAWAQNTGIAGVEVSIDGGAWQPADMGADVSIDTWRQWTFVWDAAGASPGGHTVRVRATDVNGLVQTDAQAPPRPDGATGHHGVTIQIV